MYSLATVALVVDSVPTWLSEARRAVDRAGNDKQIQDRLSHLTAVDDELHRCLDQLADLVEAAEAGHGTWWSSLDVPSKVFTDLKSARKSIDPRQWSRARNALEEVFKQAETEIRTSWQGYVTDLAGNAGDLRKLVRVLGAAPALAEEAARLDEALAQLNVSRGKLPDKESVAKARAAADLLDRLADKLPHDVRDFLTAAARGTGAPLDLLTPEVLAWLTVNSAVDEFRIIVAGKGRGQARG
ncbi:hypothetical protein [Amycolatopsis sp. NPDC004378]